MIQKYWISLTDILCQAGMVNSATKNETTKITDYILHIMRVDVQGWKGRRG